jgi:hypothetical protein
VTARRGASRAKIQWPPPKPRRSRIGHRPWDPQSPIDPTLVDHSEGLVYVVVDEMVGDEVGLSVSPWPHADSDGRLRFKSGLGPVEVATTRKELIQFFRSDRSRRRRHPIDVGFTFAAYLKKDPAEKFFRKWGEHVRELSELFHLESWLERPCDLTKQAREVAKLAYFSAVLAVLPEDREGKWNMGTKRGLRGPSSES